MVRVSTNLDDEIVRRFRHVIYVRSELKKGTIKKALEEAMLDYIEKHEDKTAEEMAVDSEVIRNQTVLEKIRFSNDLFRYY